MSSSIRPISIAAPATTTAETTRSPGPPLLASLTPADVAVKDLGKCLLPSPVAAHLGEGAMLFVGAADKVLIDDRMSHLGGIAGSVSEQPAFELAGPRNRIFFDPRTVRCGIVTCGDCARG